MTCLVRGDEPLRITWSLKGDIVSSEPSITTTMIGTRTSMLMISSVGYRHSGTYTCTAANRAGSQSHSTELLVNGSQQEREKGRDYFFIKIIIRSLSPFLSVPPTITPFSFGEETANEGEFVQVTCNIRSGDSPLSIT